jgi:cyclohexanone monooxygenase
VTLVDTKGKGVERITEKGVVANGVEYELDCLIFATGFEVGTDYTRRAGYEIYGRDGASLTEKWSNGLRTLHGMHTRGFPNCFIMGTQQSAFTVNYPHALDEQGKHIAYILRHAMDNGVRTLEASEEAEQAWVDTIISLARMGQRFLEECTPGYYNNEGKLSDLAAQNGFFGGGSIEFFRLLKEWRDKGTLPGLEVA